MEKQYLQFCMVDLVYAHNYFINNMSFHLHIPT